MVIHGNLLRNTEYESPNLYSQFLEEKARINLINPQPSSDSDKFMTDIRSKSRNNSSKVKVISEGSGTKPMGGFGKGILKQEFGWEFHGDRRQRKVMHL